MGETKIQDRFLDLELPVEVWLAEEQVPLGRLLELEPGSVLELERDPDGPVDLVVNGAVVATGELVVVDGRFGFRVGETAERELANLDPAKSTGDPGARHQAPTGTAEPSPAPQSPAAANNAPDKEEA